MALPGHPDSGFDVTDTSYSLQYVYPCPVHYYKPHYLFCMNLSVAASIIPSMKWGK